MALIGKPMIKLFLISKSFDMNIPEVAEYWELGKKEAFETYYKRFPQELSNVPRCVVENWIYRHWQCFQEDWFWLDLSKCSFKKVTYNNDEISNIDHVGDWLNTLDFWGDELFKDKTRQENTYLGKFMLETGTTPAPIIVAKNAHNIKDPRGSKMNMKVPFQLIEGHMRLAYLRGMIKSLFWVHTD